MFPLTHARRRGIVGLLSTVLRPSMWPGRAGAKVSAGYLGSGYPPILRNEIPAHNLRDHTPIAPGPMTQIANMEELEKVCPPLEKVNTL